MTPSEDDLKELLKLQFHMAANTCRDAIRALIATPSDPAVFGIDYGKLGSDETALMVRNPTPEQAEAIQRIVEGQEPLGRDFEKVWDDNVDALYGDDATPSDPVREAETAAARDVLAERARQIAVEGWTPEHDDAHVNGELRIVAAAYADRSHGLRIDGLPPYWPRTWAKHWWKPIGINDLTPSRFDLVKAAALLLAEIERIDRQAVPSRALAGSAELQDKNKGGV